MGCVGALVEGKLVLRPVDWVEGFRAFGCFVFDSGHLDSGLLYFLDVQALV